MKYLFLIGALAFVSQLTKAVSLEKKEIVYQLKKGAAVSAFNKEDGFKLTPKAIKSLGVTFKIIRGHRGWVIPKSSLVRVKYSTGVFRRWNGWITFVLVKVTNQTKETVTIKSVDLEDKDEVATTGVAFLRMTEADLNSETVDSCSH